MAEPDWANDGLHYLGMELRIKTGKGRPVFLALNAGTEPLDIHLPPTPAGQVWVRHLDSAGPNHEPEQMGARLKINGQCVVMCVLEPTAAPAK